MANITSYYNTLDFAIDCSVLFPAALVGYSMLMAYVGVRNLIEAKKYIESPDDSDDDIENDTENDGLYERMIGYKTFDNISFSDDSHYIVRLDGRKFKKLTSKFEKPYDEKFASIMLNTAMDLYKHFNPVIAHVQNDEISLVFSNNNNNFLFRGKYDKLISIIPSYASSCFTQNMIKELGECLNNVAFEAEVYKFSDDEEYDVINYLYWRSAADGYINSVSMYANHYFLAKDLIGVNTSSRIKMMELISEPFYFDNLQNHNKYGWFIKNEMMNYEMVDSSDNTQTYSRKYPVAKSFKIEYSEDLHDELLGDVWNCDCDERETKN